MTKATDPGFSASEPLQNQGLQEPKTDLIEQAPYCEEVNAVTWKLTDGSGTNTPACYGKWPAFRTTKAIAWLIGIGNGLWIARYRKQASKPMKLNAAKIYALEMVNGVRAGSNLDEPIRHLNQTAAAVVDAKADWLPPIEPDLIEYIRYVETGAEPLDYLVVPTMPVHDKAAA